MTAPLDDTHEFPHHSNDHVHLWNDERESTVPSALARLIETPTPQATQSPVILPTASPPSAGDESPGAKQQGNVLPQVDAHSGGGSSRVPRVFFIRHRLGFSMLTLSEHQCNTFTHEDLEDFLLYKERKYNAVNVLSRFSILLVIVLCITIVCNAFSLSSADWRVVEYDGGYTAMGLFVSCQNRLLRQCRSWRSSAFDRELVDTVTGETVCSASGSFVRNYIGAMWALTILQLLCELIALLLTVWVILRPTRSGETTYIAWITLFCTCLGIINCVLFPQYTKCDSRMCASMHESKPKCEVRYLWAYKLYIAATCLHALCFGLAARGNRYVQSLRSGVHEELQTARRQHTSLEGADTPPATDYWQPTEHDRLSSTVRIATPLAAPPQPILGADSTRRNQEHSNRNCDRSSNLVRMSLTAAFVSPKENGTPSHPSGNHVRADGSGTSPAVHPALDSFADNGANARSELFATQTSFNFNDTCTSAFFGEGAQAQRRSSQVVPSAPTLTEPAEHHKARKKPNRLVSLLKLGADDQPDYLTAEELGVRIPGATDWVYDDRSDMYYSFQLGSFWDPLTKEYYNCRLKSWQDETNHMIGIRDAHDFPQSRWAAAPFIAHESTHALEKVSDADEPAVSK